MAVPSCVRNVNSKIKQPERLKWPRQSEDGTELGVDVLLKQQDIVKIVHKYFHVSDIAMPELLQEVFLAVIHKNHGKSAHDPRKSSFGHYVFMIANNVCINLVNRKKRFDKERESLDSTSGRDDDRTLLETVKSVEQNEDPFHHKMEEVEVVMRRRGMWDLARYVRAARSGAAPDVVREALSWNGHVVTSKDIRDIRVRLQAVASELKSSSELWQ